ncbi:hypothetical protein VQ248_004407 [Salmonella enterica]|nr:hypothetical protein [Salmonella enterica]EMD3364569.1 hypothetical protein [Salmonella enterica]EMD4307113.1 hypothetical protein [Salmonella enterica]EMD4733139.1 hypothetical protein [Salmonella enterica]EMD4792052.1 hypothetical protein [Salmonella enterica]
MRKTFDCGQADNFGYCFFVAGGRHVLSNAYCQAAPVDSPAIDAKCSTLVKHD